MILFLARFPEGEDCRDGMAQRVLAIDDLYQAEERTYLSLSFGHFWLPSIEEKGNLKIIRAQSIIGLPLALYYGFTSRFVYIHSIYNALWACYLLPWVNFIVDMHGVVPEEEILAQRPRRSLLFGWLEALCFKHAKVAVCVTDQMGKHLREKYPRAKVLALTLPIMNPCQVAPIRTQGDAREATPTRIIYSGGMQPWQNVDLMVEAMASGPVGCEFEIYTGTVQAFKARLQAASLTCLVESLDPVELALRYQKAHFGFLLRDANLVNRVACPTKLTDYLQFGIIPIVLQPEIGDMNQLGFSYVTLEDFRAGRLPSAEAAESMRRNNWEALQRWEGIFRAGTRELAKLTAAAVQ